MNLSRSPRVLAFGECMLELQGQAFGAMQQSFGGDTLNTAVYLARCGRGAGVHVGYATALGDDTLSAGLRARWQAEGLSVDAVRTIPGRLPGLYQIELDARGERVFHYWRGQSAARDYFATEPGATPLEQQADSIDVLYLSGISLAILPPAGRERLLALLRRLRAAGAEVVFDNNYRPRLWASVEEARAVYRAVYAIANLALVTLDDELALWGAPSLEAQLEQTLALHSPELAIKRGAQSTLVREGFGAPIEVPTIAVPSVVDTTAAGDSFAGAYLAARMQGASPEAAAAAGNTLAARVIQHRGALIPIEAMRDLIDPPPSP